MTFCINYKLQWGKSKKSSVCQQRDINISLCYLFLPLVDFVSYLESITENDICESKKKDHMYCKEKWIGWKAESR